MKRFVIITAGGRGARIGGDLPKQFLPLAGKPVLMHTLQQFYDAIPDIECYLVLPEEHIVYWQKLCEKYAFNPPFRLVKGGETRFHSVKNGLDAICETDGIVAIHDGVRPFVSQKLIIKTFAKAEEKEAVIPVIPVTESLRRTEANGSVMIDRNLYRLVQTPQTFRLDLLKEAYKQPYSERFTDDASVVEALGKEIFLIEGIRGNIKITYPEDILWAEAFLSEKVESRSAEICSKHIPYLPA